MCDFVGLQILLPALEKVFKNQTPKALMGMQMNYSIKQHLWLIMGSMFCYSGPENDPGHGSPRYRVNGVFPYFPEFAEAFNCPVKNDRCPLF